MLLTKIKLHATARLTAGLLVAAATGFAAGRAGAFHDPGQAAGKATKAPASERRPASRENLALYRVKVDRIKAADLGFTAEDVRKAIVDAFESPHRMSHPMVWTNPADGREIFVRVQGPDGVPLSLEKMLDLVVLGRGHNVGVPVCPLRNVVTVTRENRSRLEAELEACEQEFAAAEAALKQAEARARRARAALVAARDRLHFALDEKAPPPAARPGRPAAKQ